MHEVHPPDHTPHGIRDFLLHIFTITVGLLIALGLENLVEWRHHVHVRHQAEANIRREIETNRKDLHGVMDAIPKESKSLRVMMPFLQDRMDGKSPQVRSMTVGLVEATLQDASWNTASTTGALSYMEYEQVERFSSAYQLQKKFEEIQQQAVTPILSIIAALGTGDPTTMTPADAAATLHDVRLALAHLEAVRSMAAATDSAYAEALKGD